MGGVANRGRRNGASKLMCRTAARKASQLSIGTTFAVPQQACPAKPCNIPRRHGAAGHWPSPAQPHLTSAPTGCTMQAVPEPNTSSRRPSSLACRQEGDHVWVGDKPHGDVKPAAQRARVGGKPHGTSRQQHCGHSGRASGCLWHRAQPWEAGWAAIVEFPTSILLVSSPSQSHLPHFIDRHRPLLSLTTNAKQTPTAS